MLTFILETKAAVLSNVNTRVERHGDEEKLGVDLDFKCNAKVDVLQQMLLQGQVDFKTILYNEKGEEYDLGLGPLAFTREFEDHGLTVRYAPGPENKRDYEVTIKKIRATPVYPHLVELKLQINISDVSEEDIAFLSHGLVLDKVHIRTKKPRQGDLLDGTETEPE